MPTTLVTGANRGIGLEHVRQALAAGEQVIAACRDPSRAEELADLTKQYPEQLRVEALEVSDAASVAALAERLKGVAVDMLINNAGYQGPGSWNPANNFQSFGTIDYDIWRDILEVNLLGVMRVTEALVPNVAASERKLIVMMTSDLASIERNSMGGTHPYRTSKAALNMLAKGLAKDLEGDGITVIALSPGWTQTDMGGPNAHWTVEQSVTNQRRTLASLNQADSGKFVNLEGVGLPW